MNKTRFIMPKLPNFTERNGQMPPNQARKVKMQENVMFIKKNFRFYNLFSLETLVKIC